LRLEFPEAGQAPWMSMAAAGMATSWLRLGTNVVVAFARSPMVTACDAWEMAANTQGRFRLGLGSQVKAHIERRYSAEFDPPGPRLRDYVEAVKACFRAFGAQEPLSHQGPYYRLSLLTEEWAPRRHPYGDIKVDVSAVNRWTCQMAAGVADGIHVHLLHSSPYLHKRLLPAVAAGAAAAGRSAGEVELTVLVFAVPGDTPRRAGTAAAAGAGPSRLLRVDP
jgi:probable F420-dependent oxidoreductase